MQNDVKTLDQRTASAHEQNPDLSRECVKEALEAKDELDAGLGTPYKRQKLEPEDNQARIRELLQGETPESKIDFYIQWLKELITIAGGQTEAAKLINSYTCGFGHDRTTLGKFLTGRGNITSIVQTTIILRAAIDFYENGGLTNETNI